MLTNFLSGSYSVIKAYFLAFSNLFILNLALSAVIIFLERKNPTSTLLWVMTVNFFPVFGFILYLLLGQDMSRRKMFAEKQSVDTNLRRQAKRQLRKIKWGSMTYHNTRIGDYEDMLQMFIRGEREMLTRDNAVEIFTNGPDKFNQLIKDIQEAKEFICFQYYIFKSDGLGRRLQDLLIQKAEEGVRVLMLIDGMGGRNFTLKDRRRLRAHGIKIAVFFPGILPRLNTHMNYRNHRKIVVIDHEIGYVGGFNVGDEYINKNPSFGYWRDTHLRLVGPAVRDLQWRFFLDYRFAGNEDDFIGFTKLSYPVKGDKELVIVSSGPDSHADSIRNGYDRMITRAKQDIYIQTPYFIPDEGLFNSLKIALMAGKNVHIMIPQKRDHPFVHWASRSFIGDLLPLGADVYLYQDGFIHSKVVLMDDFISSVGTANFDIRSFVLNFEVNAFIFDEDINGKLVKKFWMDVSHSKHLTWEDYQKRSNWTKFREDLSRLLSPIL
ncbi:Cardiolipin synthase [Urinicoccus massiliensis]|uniref:Cardiolipin synthase n=1 Tax=Urinicoccus massiliensis TaxID=1723382 RepID=A0A8H2R0X4_9FIRM|nr:cardiolipin synthase [Urinicoccus massiliensis]VFB16093.1 Cardiolipin synthase [Urinicoccus massiliensis]